MKLTIKQWDILKHGYWCWLTTKEDEYKTMIKNDPDDDNAIITLKTLLLYRAVLKELNEQVIG